MSHLKHWTPQQLAERELRIVPGSLLKRPAITTAVSLPAEARERNMKKKTQRIESANREMGGDAVKITLPYPPSANRYWRSVVIAGQVRVLVSSEARAYKQAAGKLAGRVFKKKMAGPVGIRLQVFRPRRSGDLGNRIKVIEDVLQGHAFENDSQIEVIEAARFEDKENPRVEVSVWQL